MIGIMVWATVVLRRPLGRWTAIVVVQDAVAVLIRGLGLPLAALEALDVAPLARLPRQPVQLGHEARCRQAAAGRVGLDTKAQGEPDGAVPPQAQHPIT